MQSYANILANFGGHGAGVINQIAGTMPPIYYRHNAAGGGFQAHMVLGLQPNLTGWHWTIFQTSWDGTAAIADLDGTMVNVGPNCFHLTINPGTAAAVRAFYIVSANGALEEVTDHGDASGRCLTAAKLLITQIKRHII